MSYKKPKNLDEEASVHYQHYKWKKCSHGHLNSPSAQVCWKCGEKLV